MDNSDQSTSKSIFKGKNGEVTTYTYNELNQLISDSNTTYRYDANGNLVSANSSDKSVTYSYNASGMMTEAVVTENGITTGESYTYDAFGNRVSKTTDGNTVYYLNDIGGSLTQVMAELDNEGNLLAYYNRGFTLISRYGVVSATASAVSETDIMESEETEKTVSTYIATAGDASISEKPEQAETSEQAEETETLIVSEPVAIANEEDSLYETIYYITDGHGSVRILTDEAGNITDRYDYDAYGSIFYQEGMTDNHYLYAGEQQDEITGLYYLRARYMDVETGRFTSMDSYAGSIFDPASLHKYLYANANPVMYTDPSGYVASLTEILAAGVGDIGRSTAMAVLLNIGMTIYSQFRVKDETGKVINPVELITNALEAGEIAAILTAVYLVASHMNSVALFIVLGGITLYFTMLMFEAAGKALKNQDYDLALLYGMFEVLGALGTKYCFENASQISMARNAARSMTNTDIGNACRAGSKGSTETGYENLLPRSGSEWESYFINKYGKGNVHWNLNSVDDIWNDPTRMAGYSENEIASLTGEGWTRGTYGSKGDGWKFMKDDVSVFYHPSGGKHGGAYYGISSGLTGKIKVVDPNTYIPLPGDRATIFYH